MISASFGDSLGAALRDTWPALRTWLGWAIAIVLVCSSGLIAVAFLNPPTDNVAPNTAWEGEAGAALSLAFIVAAFFAIASAVRTVRPEFRMTFGRFFGVIGYSLVVGIIVAAGILCFVLPGLYLAVKLSLAPYYYLIGEPGNHPLRTAWTSTRGRFWLTAGMIVAVGVIIEAVAYAAAGAVAALALISPATGLITVPLAFALFLAALQFQYNAYVRWSTALLESA